MTSWRDYQDLAGDVLKTAPINSRLNVVVRSPPRLGWVEMAIGLPEGPSYPVTPLHFFAMLAPERPQKGSTQLP